MKMDVLEQGAGIATIATAIVSTIIAAAGGVAFQVKWIVGLVRKEEEARAESEREIWKAIELHKKDETDHERAMASKIENLATKADLINQTTQLLEVFKLLKNN
jgi:hypothetical protein